MAYLSQSGHQNPNAGGTDDQQFSLNTASNIVTFTLEDGGAPKTLDLTPYLPDGIGTDDQRISQFGVIGTNLVISIEGGNTVSIPLSSLPDNDQQTLSLAGSTLSIFNGNSVNLASINTDDQILTSTTGADGETDSITISGGNTIPIEQSRFIYVPIWAEQNGGVTNTRWNFSWGNGNEHTGTGINDWGYVTPYAGTIEAMSIGMRGTNTAATEIEITVNGVSSGATLLVAGSQTKARIKFTSPVSFNAGDALNFRTVQNGGGNDVVPTAILKMDLTS